MWIPTPGARNGDVWNTLGSAVWAVRRASTRPAGQAFPAAMRDLIDLGYDTDPLAAVTGGLLGATLGIQAIPSRWTNAVNGDLPGLHAPHGFTELQDLALHRRGVGGALRAADAQQTWREASGSDSSNLSAAGGRVSR